MTSLLPTVDIATLRAKILQKTGRAVITDHVRPPIPTTKFDWTATLDGYEPDEPYAFGETEEEAIRNLMERLELDYCECGVLTKDGVCTIGSPRSCSNNI